jgi:UDP-4-amino-4,6-dideoxy-N-acetyl-beta-L-altrosamine transaminase
MDEHRQFADVDRTKSGAYRQSLMSTIPYGRQDINQADIDAVVDILRSDFLTQGPVVPDFEKAVADYCGTQHAVSVNSATSALHIACLALGLKVGDWLWTSPITFVASANCALYCGASVDFVDIDPNTYNISVDQLAEKLAKAEKSGTLPKIVVPVHHCGQPCDMVGIYELSKKYGFAIIEDASHAIGGKYKEEPIGNGRYSDITVFSFHPVKIITTGEGGMAVTNDATLCKKMRLLRSHCVSSTAEDMQPRPAQEIWNYQQIDLGFNYRMTDIHAALGLSQMQRLDEFVTKRHAIAKRYEQLLSSLPLLTPWQHADNYSSYHLYVIRLNLAEINKTQRQVYDTLRVGKILVNLHYIPVYRQPYYEQMGFNVGYCPQAEQYYSEAISIPMYSDLTETQQDRVVAVLCEAIGV